VKQLREEISRIETDLQRIEMDIQVKRLHMVDLSIHACTQLLLDQEKAKQAEIDDLEKQKSTTTVDVNHLNQLNQQVTVYQAGETCSPH